MPMSSRISQTRKKKKSPEGRSALRRVRGLISKNRLTVARIQRMKLPELVTLATVLKAAHDVSKDTQEQQAIKNVIAFINQTAQAQASPVPAQAGKAGEGGSTHGEQ